MSYLFRRTKVPKSMPVKETEYLLRALKDIRQVATMKTFQHKDDIVIKKLNFNEVEEITLEEATKIWRKTWILDPLDEIINRYENHLNKKS